MLAFVGSLLSRIFDTIRKAAMASRKNDCKQCTDVDDCWLNDTLEELDKAASCIAPPVSVSRCVDVVDGSRYVDEGDFPVLTDTEREAGKRAFCDEEGRCRSRRSRWAGAWCATT